MLSPSIVTSVVLADTFIEEVVMFARVFPASDIALNVRRYPTSFPPICSSARGYQLTLIDEALVRLYAVTLVRDFVGTNEIK